MVTSQNSKFFKLSKKQMNEKKFKCCGIGIRYKSKFRKLVDLWKTYALQKE